MRRKSCRVVVFGHARAPWRDNLDEAQQDAASLGLGFYDEANRFYLKVPAEFEWGYAEERVAA
jgi:hypothetical protein